MGYKKVFKPIIGRKKVYPTQLEDDTVTDTRINNDRGWFCLPSYCIHGCKKIWKGGKVRNDGQCQVANKVIAVTAGVAYTVL